MKKDLTKMQVRWAIVMIIFLVSVVTGAQPAYDYSKPFLATSQLGFRIHSKKHVVLVPGTGKEKLPDSVQFYITKIGGRLPRETGAPELWKNTIFKWPFEIDKGKYLPMDQSKPPYLYTGKLVKSKGRWGTFWFADISDFMQKGFFQIETVYCSTVPFLVDDKLYERLDRSYLELTYCQRSGVEIPGIRPEENSDDGRLMSKPSYYIPVAGGWNDAGDWRKWMSLTQGNLEALLDIYRFGHPAFREQALNELRWGNSYYHNMVSDSGFVYEDTGGGFNRAEGMDASWWNENHPGVNAGGDMDADNIPMNGNERSVRDQYNALVQNQFVRYQALCSSVLTGPDRSNCRILAERAWQYGQKHPHDNRTIFIAEELLAAAELINAGSVNVELERVKQLIEMLIGRQEIHDSGLSGYFMEKDHTDGYRSIAFPAEPGMALLRILELNIPELGDYKKRIETCLTSYIDSYLIRDSKSNPFNIPPYGIYTRPQYPEMQLFRDAGNGRHVRTFLHVFYDRPMPHGVNGNFLAQANFIARSAKHFGRIEWADFAEGILQWSTGFNTTGLCLFTGVGFKHQVPASFLNYMIPSAVSVGFMGRPDDTPYLETSNAVEWSTQEVWDVPFYNTVQLICSLNHFSKK